MTKTVKVTLTASIDADVAAAIAAEAREKGLNVSKIVNHALTKYVQHRKSTERPSRLATVKSNA